MRSRKLTGCLVLACVCWLPLRAARAATDTVIYSFGNFPYGLNPSGTLIRGANGNLYGTTNQGGTYNLGVVFEWSSSGYKVLHSFQGGADGASPSAGVTIDPAGNLYGTTYSGGPANAGVVYKIAAGGEETVVYAFTGGTDGGNPYAGVILDSAGNLYGTTVYGGSANLGLVYEITPAGQETVLYTFTGAPAGVYPYGGVISDPDGNLYGTTFGEPYPAYVPGTIFKLGTTGQMTVLFTFKSSATKAGLVRDSAGDLYGTVTEAIFELTTSGSLKTLHTFDDIGPNELESGLAMDAAGNLYGTTQKSGTAGPGTVYELTTAGQLETLYHFPGASASAHPASTGPTPGVTLDSAGNIYGATPYGGMAGVIFELPGYGPASILYTFVPAPRGTYPYNPVVRDQQGNLYGTTINGGATNWGVIYKINRSGQSQTLHEFQYCCGGTGLTLDSAGNLYGTAVEPSAGHLLGCIFKIPPSGQYSVVYTFAYPIGADQVILDAAGNMYGVGGPGAYGNGMIFKLTPSEQFTVLHSFTGGDDGALPNPVLTLDSAGNLYGTTNEGGIGAGVVFEVSAGGAFSVLYSFTAQADGGYPLAGVVLDAAGNLYGTTADYGKLSTGLDGSGVVFQLSTGGTYKVLYTFTDGADGGAPESIVRDSGGNIYGTTAYGGDPTCDVNQGCGVVFQLSPAGAFTVLDTFTGNNGGLPFGFIGGPGGALPYTGPILGPNGELYGTTANGGTANGGVVYKITP